MDNSARNNQIFLILLILSIFIFTAATIFLIIKDRNSPQKQLQKAIQDYKSLDLRALFNERYTDTLFSVRDGLIDRALTIVKDLEAGDKQKTLEDAQALKKRLEGQSRADKAGMTEINSDKNNDKMTDYLEPFYKTIVEVSQELK